MLAALRAEQEEKEEKRESGAEAGLHSATKAELRQICSRAIKMAEHQLSVALNMESRMFFLKAMGDYLRYSAQLLEGPEHDSVTKSCGECYGEAVASAGSVDLPPSHPLRVGVLLKT